MFRWIFPYVGLWLGRVAGVVRGVGRCEYEDTGVSMLGCCSLSKCTHMCACRKRSRLQKHQQWRRKQRQIAYIRNNYMPAGYHCWGFFGAITHICTATRAHTHARTCPHSHPPTHIHMNISLTHALASVHLPPLHAAYGYVRVNVEAGSGARGALRDCLPVPPCWC